jgi:hypothetical protein
MHDERTDDPRVEQALRRVSAAVWRAFLAAELGAAAQSPPDGHREGASPSKLAPTDVDPTLPPQRLMSCLPPA